MTIYSEEVAKIIADRTGLMVKQAKQVIDVLEEITVTALQNGDKVQLTGFGTFSTKDIAERNGSDPNTHCRIVIPAKKKIVFSPGTLLKRMMKGEI